MNLDIKQINHLKIWIVQQVEEIKIKTEQLVIWL